MMFENRLKNTKNYLLSGVKMWQIAWQTHAGLVLASLLTQLLVGAMPILIAWLNKTIFDEVATLFNNSRVPDFVATFIPLLTALALLVVVFSVITKISHFISEELVRHLQITTQTLIYSRLNQFYGLEPFENAKFYDTVRMATQGVGHGPRQMVAISIALVTSTVSVFSFVGVLLIIHPVLVVALLCATLPHAFISFRLSQHNVGVIVQNSPLQRQVSYYSMILSHLNFAKEVRLYQVGDHFLERLTATQQTIHHRERQISWKKIRWETVAVVISQLVSMLSFGFVIYQSVLGKITIGDITLYIAASTTVQGALQQIIGSLTRLHEAILFFNHFSTLQAIQESVEQPKMPVSIPPLQHGIEFRNIHFRYTDDDPWIFRNFNLFLPKGKCAALVGINGSGKTTLIKLLTRLYTPVAGQIFWDGIDIQSFDVKALREHIRVIFQDFVRYDLTAYENIGLGAVEELYNLERIRRVATQSDAHSFLSKLPQGYDTVLSRWLVENGAGTDLSGGQWQRVAIARMLMHESDLLILDEPTAALDPEAEYHLYQSFREMSERFTTLLISHRFSTVRLADLIAVIENGEIAEYGSHSQLLAQNGTYAHLYHLQVERFNI